MEPTNQREAGKEAAKLGQVTQIDVGKIQALCGKPNLDDYRCVIQRETTKSVQTWSRATKATCRICELSKIDDEKTVQGEMEPRQPLRRSALVLVSVAAQKRQ